MAEVRGLMIATVIICLKINTNKMDVEIKITIEASEEYFNKIELRSNIMAGFPERTGYEIKYLEIEINE